MFSAYHPSAYYPASPVDDYDVLAEEYEQRAVHARMMAQRRAHAAAAARAYRPSYPSLDPYEYEYFEPEVAHRHFASRRPAHPVPPVRRHSRPAWATEASYEDCTCAPEAYYAPPSSHSRPRFPTRHALPPAHRCHHVAHEEYEYEPEFEAPAFPRRQLPAPQPQRARRQQPPHQPVDESQRPQTVDANLIIEKLVEAFGLGQSQTTQVQHNQSRVQQLQSQQENQARIATQAAQAQVQAAAAARAQAQAESLRIAQAAERARARYIEGQKQAAIIAALQQPNAETQAPASSLPADQFSQFTNALQSGQGAEIAQLMQHVLEAALKEADTQQTQNASATSDTPSVSISGVSPHNPVPTPSSSHSPAAVRYTYAQPASAQLRVGPSTSQPSSSAGPSNISEAESQRRDNAAIEAQQIMAAIKASLDPTNDVKPSKSVSFAESISYSDKGKGKDPSETPRGRPPTISSSAPTQAPVRVPVRSPSPPKQEPKAPLDAIDSVESEFVNLSYGFTFPSRVDFAPSSTAAPTTPPMAYTTNNAPIRQYEHALTGLLTKLDAVEANGDGVVRMRRKELVARIEGALETLDAKKEAAWKNESSGNVAEQTNVEDVAQKDEAVEEVKGYDLVPEVEEKTESVVSASTIADESTAEDQITVEESSASHSHSPLISSNDLPPTDDTSITPSDDVSPVPENKGDDSIHPTSELIAPVDASASEQPFTSYPPTPSYPPTSTYPPSAPAPTYAAVLSTFAPESDSASQSTTSSPVNLPSEIDEEDIAEAESEGETQKAKSAAEIPPSMEESNKLEEKTEFVMI